MKKLLVSVLAICLLLSLSACGATNTADGGEAPSLHGSIDRTTNTYTNEFLGLTAKFPSNYNFSTDEEMAELNKITADTLANVNEAYREVIKNNQIIYEMYVSNNNGDSVNLNFENLSKVSLNIQNEEEYVNEAIKSVPSALESIGYTDVNAEKTTATLGGQTHQAIRVSAKISQFSFHELIVCIKVDNYVANITFASFTEDTIDELASCFQAI
ncbi:MAG: hypothetical protein IJB27_05600 [Clostridia bacterium]|nr:hypothetical protein [Clostridia bacterium]